MDVNGVVKEPMYVVSLAIHVEDHSVIEHGPSLNPGRTK